MNEQKKNPLSINDINNKLQDIHKDITVLKEFINSESVPNNTEIKIKNLKKDLESIVNIINIISGINKSLETYINSLINDMTNSSLKNSFYIIENNTVKSTDLLKAELKMIRELSDNTSDIINNLKSRTNNITDRENILKAIKDADIEIDIK